MKQSSQTTTSQHAAWLAQTKVMHVSNFNTTQLRANAILLQRMDALLLKTMPGLFIHKLNPMPQFSLKPLKQFKKLRHNLLLLLAQLKEIKQRVIDVLLNKVWEKQARNVMTPRKLVKMPIPPQKLQLPKVKLQTAILMLTLKRFATLTTVF